MAHVYTDAIIVVPYACVVTTATFSAPGTAGRAGRAGWVAQPRVTPVGVAQPFCRHWLPYIDLGHVGSQWLRKLGQFNVVRRGNRTPRSCHVRFGIGMVAKLVPQCDFSICPKLHFGLWRYVCR